MDKCPLQALEFRSQFCLHSRHKSILERGDELEFSALVISHLKIFKPMRPACKLPITSSCPLSNLIRAPLRRPAL